MPFLLALLPSLGVLFLFWLAIRAMLNADRNERLAQARFESERRAADELRAPGGSEPRAL